MKRVEPAYLPDPAYRRIPGFRAAAPIISALNVGPPDIVDVPGEGTVEGVRLTESEDCGPRIVFAAPLLDFFADFFFATGVALNNQQASINRASTLARAPIL